MCNNHVVLVHQGCSTSPLAVTWLTVYRQLHIITRRAASVYLQLEWGRIGRIVGREKTGPRRPLTRACSRLIRHIAMILWGSSNTYMISILTKGRDIPRHGCGGHPGGEQCFWDPYGIKNQDCLIVPALKWPQIIPDAPGKLPRHSQ